jgi:hypothetical protein
MDIGFSAEQEMLRDTLRRALERTVDYAKLRVAALMGA